MSWHFVERWLQKVYQHSTLVGKFWITFLIIFRIVVVSSISDRVYSDEQSEFKCNVGPQPGCENVCFNKFSPISHLRYWSFQILAVAMPSVIFVIYSGHKGKEREKLAKLEAKDNANEMKKMMAPTMLGKRLEESSRDPRDHRDLCFENKTYKCRKIQDNHISNKGKSYEKE